MSSQDGTITVGEGSANYGGPSNYVSSGQFHMLWASAEETWFEGDVVRLRMRFFLVKKQLIEHLIKTNWRI